MRIAIFHHSLFVLGDPPEMLPAALEIVCDQMEALRSSGLLDAAEEMHCGVNGGQESEMFANGLLPKKAQITYHGLQSRNENSTLLMLEKWVPNHLDWYVLYFHSKGASHATGSAYGSFANRWRLRMEQHCLHGWRQCVEDLDAGYEACGCHWLTGQGWDRSQHFFAGTFFFVKASFWATIPSLLTRQRIKDSGITALESRYESEVIMGNGPRLPRVKNYYDGEIGT
jgi:hypothetical protein